MGYRDLVTADEKTALLDTIDEGLAQLGPSRPSAARITRAKTLFKEVRVACQNIPISPVTDGGEPVPPVTPGPETPPVEPAPPETPPVGGGGGGSTSPPTTTTVTTTYTSNGDFGGTQGYRGWTYLNGNLEDVLTYDAARQLWTGPQLYQFIWSDGCHSGPSIGVVRRFTSPSASTYSITGSIKFFNDPIGGTSALPVTIKKNGASIYSQTVADNDIVGYAVSNLTGSVAVGDTLDFFVGPPSGPGTAHENFNSTFSIALTTTTTTGGGSSTQTTLPFTLNGTAPEEGTYTLTANKPSNADGCTIQITGVNLAASYGRVYFNGSTNSLALWPTAPGNAGISATVTVAVPVAYLVNGNNTLRFTHDSGSGYTITAIAAPVFTTPATPTPPATQTSLPFDLRGSILPEDAILTLSLSKPSNANGATLTITGVNLTGNMGAYYINGTLASQLWVDVPANAGVSATVVRSPDPTLFQNGNNAIRFTHTSGAGYTVSSVNVTFSTPSPGTDTGPPAGNNGAFLNEPAGLERFLNHSFDVIVGPGMSNPYGAGQIVQDPTAPLSPPNVHKSTLNHITGHGGTELHWDAPRRITQIFVGMWWRTNPEFTGGIANANKTFFIKGSLGNQNGVFYLRSNPGEAKFLYWCTQLAYNLNQCFGAPDQDHCHPNVTKTPIIPGVWYKIETYMKASSTPTTRDGIVRWWINGVLNGNFNNFAYGPVVDQWVWSETWDGQGAGNGFTQDASHYLDHLYISGA